MTQFWIKINEAGQILFALRTDKPDHEPPMDYLPITDLEYKFLRRYGLDLEPVSQARFARSIKSKIRKYLGV